jgi:hypothetical protein
MRKTPAHQVVAEKRELHHPPSAEERAQGFKGWFSRSYQPHFDVPGAWQFDILKTIRSRPV